MNVRDLEKRYAEKLEVYYGMQARGDLTKYGSHSLSWTRQILEELRSLDEFKEIK